MNSSQIEDKKLASALPITNITLKEMTTQKVSEDASHNQTFINLTNLE